MSDRLLVPAAPNESSTDPNQSPVTATQLILLNRWPNFGLDVDCQRSWNNPYEGVPTKCKTQRTMAEAFLFFIVFVSLVLQVLIYKNTTGDAAASIVARAGSDEEDAAPSGPIEVARYMFTTLLVQLDYMSDAFYIGRNDFATPLLYVLALVFFFIPYGMFIAQFPDVVKAHWRCLFTHPAFHTTDRAYAAVDYLRARTHSRRWDKAHKAVLHMLGSFVAAVASVVVSIPNAFIFCVFFCIWSILVYAFVELKLFSIPSFSVAILTFGQEPFEPKKNKKSGKASRGFFDEETLSYVYNSSTVLRMGICTVPHLIIVTANTIMLLEAGRDRSLTASTELIFTVSTSSLLIVSQIWPVAHSIYRHKSFVEGMRNRRHPAFGGVKRIDETMRRFEGVLGLIHSKKQTADQEPESTENPMAAAAARGSDSENDQGSNGDVEIRDFERADAGVTAPNRAALAREIAGEIEEKYRKVMEEKERKHQEEIQRQQQDIKRQGEEILRLEEEEQRLQVKLAEAEADE